MAKFRSKPVEIEAVQLTRDLIGAALFTGGALPAGVTFRGEVVITEQRFIGNFICDSRQGEVSAEIDDWIIAEPGAEGFLAYPCKPDVFAAKYEGVPFVPLDGETGQPIPEFEATPKTSIAGSGADESDG